MTRKKKVFIDGVTPRREHEPQGVVNINIVQIMTGYEGEDVHYKGIMLSVVMDNQTAEIYLPVEDWMRVIGSLSRCVAKTIPANNR